MTIIFTKNGNFWPFWVKIIVISWISSASNSVIFFSAWDKSRDSSANNQKLEQMEWTPVSMLNKQVDEETMEQEMSFYVDAKHQGNLSRGIGNKNFRR